MKKENCKKEGVFLLVVDYISKIRTPEQMIFYVLSLLEENNLPYVLNKEKIINRINDLYITKDGFLKYIK